MRRRVVITGMGCVTPLGTSVEEFWSRLLRGESGVGYTTVFDASNFPTQISAEVRDWDVSAIGEDPQRWKYHGRHTRFAAGAAKQAVACRRHRRRRRTDPVRRLSGQRRRAARLRPLHQHDGQAL